MVGCLRYLLARGDVGTKIAARRGIKVKLRGARGRFYNSRIAKEEAMKDRAGIEEFGAKQNILVKKSQNFGMMVDLVFS